MYKLDAYLTSGTIRKGMGDKTDIKNYWIQFPGVITYIYFFSTPPILFFFSASTSLLAESMDRIKEDQA